MSIVESIMNDSRFELITEDEDTTDVVKPLDGISFCFTGSMVTQSRSEAKQKVENLGGSVKSSVSKKLSYLVTNDTTSGTSKNVKAQSLGVQIIDETQFNNILSDVSVSTDDKGVFDL
jgi:NAD-dependent DNA ligase